MKVQIIKNDNYFMSYDFQLWIDEHRSDIFKVKEEVIGNDGLPAYILFKVSFRISKHFTKSVE